MTKGYFCRCRWMDLGILLNASDGIAVIAWLWLCDGMPHCRSAAQGVRVSEF
jgi:hypothetical protein